MMIRTILVPLSGGAASEGAVETACRLALRFGAHLEALHVRADPTEVVALLGPDAVMPVSAEIIDRVARDSEEIAAKARARFDEAIARHAIPLRDKPLDPTKAASGSVSASWREETGHAPDIVPRRARVFDLVVLGQSGRVTDEPHTDTLEETVLRGGRPVLLAPIRPIVPVGVVVAVAWNGSVEAARAVAASMPFLAKASEVHILTADNADDPAVDLDLPDYFAWHGIAATPHIIRSVPGVATGELVLAAARDNGADLLVMGGYGHAPWREMVFGGTTRQIVGVSRLPLLLAH
jgi:nucleotide-binding universal stress UspA family protein